MNVFKQFVQFNIKLSNYFDDCLAEKFRIDGCNDFESSFLPSFLGHNLRVYDVGGGKTPSLSRDQKDQFNLTIVGLDISDTELGRAPDGIYDEIICADICRYVGKADADLVICRALLEHVRNTEDAFRGLETILKREGKLLIQVPSRNAVYARLNLLLPQKLKEAILDNVFPESKQIQGFPAFYNQCTKNGFRRLGLKYRMNIREERFYFSSSYFKFLFPVHLIWRIWVCVFYLIAGNNAAETFCICLEKARPAAA